MTPRSWKLGALICFGVWVAPALAAASAMPVESLESREADARAARLGWVMVSGQGRLSHAEVDVQCEELDLGLVVRSTSCHVLARAMLTAMAPLSLRRVLPEEGYRGGPLPDDITVGGEHLGAGPIQVAPSSRVLVRIEFDFAISTSTSPDFDWVMMANTTRHLVMGESLGLDRHDGVHRAPLISGDRLTFEGEASLHADPPEHVHIDAQLRTDDTTVFSVQTHIEAQRFEEGFQNGGLVIEVGARAPNLDADSWNLALGVGYEVALFEFFFARAMVESDLQSVSQSLVLEAATPHLIVIFPSLSAGVGAVMAESFDGQVRGALRMRLGVQTLPLFVLGLGMSFDYWPETGLWSGTLSARVSI